MEAESIAAGVGEVFDIRLRSTPTSGYLWTLSSVPDGIVPLGTGADSSGAGPGAPAMQMFSFRAVARGRYLIELVLKRPWETGAIETRTVEVLVQ